MFGAIGAALGGLAASVGNYFSQQETNRTNVDMANNQMKKKRSQTQTKILKLWKTFSKKLNLI